MKLRAGDNETGDRRANRAVGPGLRNFRPVVGRARAIVSKGGIRQTAKDAVMEVGVRATLPACCQRRSRDAGTPDRERTRKAEGITCKLRGNYDRLRNCQLNFRAAMEANEKSDPVSSYLLPL